MPLTLFVKQTDLAVIFSRFLLVLFYRPFRPHFVSLSESVHQCLRHDPAVWGAVRSLERTHHGPTQGEASGSW